MYVIGTAGHVDHGKSTLIKALTGIDPDRLREEQERGMTIVLGFAWLSLPSGREVSIVDVPGHERFVKNMLAGVGGIDLALLVVAADESVMPQTREHLAILDLLRVRRGMAVIAKKDLVDQEWLELVQAEVEEVLKGTSMEGAPILAVSAVTGEGLEEMKQAIDDLLAKTEPRKDLGRSRLAIDRVFTMSGFGTVVTGTLIDGSLSLGQEVELALSGRRYRVRGLQTHRRKIEKAIPGSRVAVNLSGVSPEDIQRGEVLTIRGWLRPTRAVDAHLRLISDAPRPVPHNFPVTFHLGATETPARVRLLDREQLKPGETGWAQLHLQDPVVVVKGDYFVIRATGYTLGGGNIVDPHAKRHRRRHAPTLERLEVMEQGSAADILVKALEGAEPADLKSLANRANVSLEDTKRLAAETAQEGRLVVLGDGRPGPSSLLYTAPGWNAVTEKARSALSAYHKQHPLRKGAPKEELRSRLGLSPQTFPLALARLTRDGALVEEGPFLRLTGHRLELSPVQQRHLDDYLRALEAEPYTPPTDAALEPDLLSLLIDEGKVVKVSEEVVFAASAYQEMAQRIVTHIKERGKITVGEVRDLLDTSRKYALPLLEYLDQQRITRRVGDERVLR